MKKIALMIKEKTSLLLVLFVTLIAFSACEKTDNTDDEIRGNNIPIDSKTEMIIVSNEQWIEKGDKMEACLHSAFYNSADKYDYVRVFSKVNDESKQERDYTWEEMPNSEYSFRIDNNNIFVQRDKLNKEIAHFLVAVKTKK